MCLNGLLSTGGKRQRGCVSMVNREQGGGSTWICGFIVCTGVCMLSQEGSRGERVGGFGREVTWDGTSRERGGPPTIEVSY